MGDDSIPLHVRHMKETHPKKNRVKRLGILELHQLADKADYIIENRYDTLTNQLDKFDPLLQGPQYKRLRSDVRRATREGLVFSTATKDDVEKITDLYYSWKIFMKMRRKELNKTDWILGRPIAADHYQIFKVERGREILAAAGVGFFGETAFMDFRINGYNTCKASEFLDYQIFLELRKKGVKFLERGVDLGKELHDYKSKFPPMETRHCYDLSDVDPIHNKMPWRMVYSTAAGLLLAIGLFSNVRHQYRIGIEGNKITKKLEMVLAGREKALEEKIYEIFLSRLKLAPEPTPFESSFEDWEKIRDREWAEYEKKKDALDKEMGALKDLKSGIQDARLGLDN